MAVHSNLILLPFNVALRLVISFSFVNLFETSVGSVPALNNSVVFMLSGVYALGNNPLPGEFRSIVTLTTLLGFVNDGVPVNIPFISCELFKGKTFKEKCKLSKKKKHYQKATN